MAAFKYSFELLLHLRCETCKEWFTLSVKDETVKIYICPNPNCKAELTDGREMPMIVK